MTVSRCVDFDDRDGGGFTDPDVGLAARTDDAPFAQADRGREWYHGFWPSALGSIVFHVAAVLVIYSVMRNFDNAATETTPFAAIEIDFVELAAPRRKEPQPQLPGTPAVPVPAQTAPHQTPLSIPKEDIWHPLSQSADDQEARARNLADIACPRFIDPSDPAAMERCSNHTFSSQPADGALAGRIASRLEREAIRNGWASADIPIDPEHATKERESVREAPGAEVFGPWPWE